MSEIAMLRQLTTYGSVRLPESMLPERHTVPFRWLLPIAQLVLSVVVLWPLHMALVHNVRLSISAYRHQRTPLPPLPEGQQYRILEVPLSPQEQRELETVEGLEKREWVPIMLNLPSGLVQLPYAILNPTKEEWMPRGMDFKTWRVISWPLIGILFWWCAGRGLDALPAARRHLIHPRIAWFETVVGAVLFLFCAVIAIGIPICAGVDNDFPMKLFVAGSGTWAVLGGMMTAARVAQRRVVRATVGPSNSPDVAPA
jgi:hypothetical protein